MESLSFTVIHYVTLAKNTAVGRSFLVCRERIMSVPTLEGVWWRNSVRHCIAGTEGVGGWAVLVPLVVVGSRSK